MRQESTDEGRQEGVHGMCQVREAQAPICPSSGLQEMCPFGQKGLRNLHEEIPKGGQLRMRQEGLNEGGKEGVYGVCQVREAQS